MSSEKLSVKKFSRESSELNDFLKSRKSINTANSHLVVIIVLKGQARLELTPVTIVFGLT